MDTDEKPTPQRCTRCKKPIRTNEEWWDHIGRCSPLLEPDPDADTVCDYCDGSGEVYAQNRSPLHIHQDVMGVWRQWPARPVSDGR